MSTTHLTVLFIAVSPEIASQMHPNWNAKSYPTHHLFAMLSFIAQCAYKIQQQTLGLWVSMSTAHSPTVFQTSCTILLSSRY